MAISCKYDSFIFHKHFKVLVHFNHIFDCVIYPSNCECYDIDEFFMSAHKKASSALLDFMLENSKCMLLRWCLFLEIKIVDINYKRSSIIKNQAFILQIESQNFDTIYPTHGQCKLAVLRNTLYGQVQKAFSSLVKNIYEKKTSFHLEEIIKLKIECVDYTDQISSD